MNFYFRYFFIALASIFTGFASAQQMTMLPGEVTNFELPRFDETTGNKLWELFGKKAKFLDSDRIAATDIRLELFDKKTLALRATAESPSANVSVSKKTVESPSKLFIKGEEFDLSGVKWFWDGDADLVKIFSNVVINFNPKQDSKDEKKSSKKDTISAQKTVITGNSAKLDNSGKDNKFFIDGNAKVRSENLAVDCDNIETISGDSGTKVGSNEISMIYARGNVVMTRDNRVAKAQKAVIYARENEAVLSGSPEIEDLASKATLSGFEIHFLKETKSVKTYSSKDFSTRAKSVFFHSSDSGELQKIEIEANEILMTSEDSQNRFVFAGKVKVKGAEFAAKCEKITVLAKNAETEKPEVKVIECRQNVSLSNVDGNATAREMDIFPKKGAETFELRGDVVLISAKDSSKLTASKLTLFKAENRGIAEASKRGYVRLLIPEDASSSAISSIDGTLSGKSSVSKSRIGKQRASKQQNSVISSRSIEFFRKGDSSKFIFSKDVSIVSPKVSATCEKMIVYSVSKKGEAQKNNSGKIEKIEAFENVRIVQNAYTASSEVAMIYPIVDSADKKAPHKFVELLVSKEKPNVRPKILLPPMREMGFDTPNSKKSRPRMTVIVSDRQWLISEAGGEKYFFEGNVKISATDTEGACDKIEVKIPPQTRGKRREISEIMLTDNVQLTSGLKDISCGKAHIYARDKVAILTKNPIVFNREDNTRAAGEKIVYNHGSKIVSIQEDTSGAVDEFDEVEKKRPSITLPEFDLSNMNKKSKK